MTRLFTTTAIVLALGLPIGGFAETAAKTTTETAAPAVDANAGASTGFLAARSASQFLATNLIGHDVYARRTPVDMTATAQAPKAGAMAPVTAADLKDMDNVGQINDLVLSKDGSVVAVVIGVGGFLGVGEQNVAVTMNEVSFAANPDQPKDFYVLVNTSGDMLKGSPPFDRSSMADDGAAALAPAAGDQAAATTTTADASAGSAADRTMLTPPKMARDGYTSMKAADVSIDTLIGKSVYGTDDKSVGTVSDVTVDASGAAKDVVIDFGGFLGMGTTKVALSYDELTILGDGNTKDIRVYVDATKEQIRAMPVYTATN